MINKIFDVVAKYLEAGDEVQHLFPSQHEGKRGYVVFSKDKMFYVEEDRLANEAADLFFEIPLWAISGIEEGEDRFVVSANDGDKYSFESVFSSQVKTDFEKLREEQLITVISINRS